MIPLSKPDTTPGHRSDRTGRYWGEKYHRKDSQEQYLRTSRVILQPQMYLILLFTRQSKELASEPCQLFCLLWSSKPRQIKIKEPKFSARSMKGGRRGEPTVPITVGQIRRNVDHRQRTELRRGIERWVHCHRALVPWSSRSSVLRGQEVLVGWKEALRAGGNGVPFSLARSNSCRCGK